MILARVYAEHPDLALAPTIRTLPDIEVAVVSDASTDPDNAVYFFRFDAADYDELEATFEADHTVTDFSLIVEGNGARTYRIEYAGETKLLSPPLADVGGLTIGAENHLNGWILHLQFQDHDGLYALDEYTTEREIHLDVLELQHVDGYDRDPDFGLTEPQREALLTAYDHGYYDEPRESSLEELAEQLEL